jgi:hypothetical protein
MIAADTSTSNMDIRKFPDWYRQYRWEGKHRLFGYPPDEYPGFVWITSLEERFRRFRESPRSDPTSLIEEMIQWGGNQHGVLKRFDSALRSYCLADRLHEVLDRLQSTAIAVDAALAIRGLGLTYASKLLRFLAPERYGALDSRLRKALTPSVLPRIYDGHRRSMIAGYCAFSGYVDALRQQLLINGINRPCETEEQLFWRPADIEMALFQWASAGATQRDRHGGSI